MSRIIKIFLFLFISTLVLTWHLNSVRASAPVCSSTHYNCASGTPINGSETSTAWTWLCRNANNVDASCSEPKPQNQSPVGNLDPITCDIIGGWAFDPNTPGDSISVHIYDGGAGPGKLIAGVTANGDRPDVRSTYGISGNHGFTITTPANLKDGKNHSIYAYGIDSSGNPNYNSNLSSSPQNLNCSAPEGSIKITNNKERFSYCVFKDGVQTFCENRSKTFSGYPSGSSYSVKPSDQDGYTWAVSPSGSQTLSTGGVVSFDVVYTRKLSVASITCSPTSVSYGGSANVSWSSTNANSCTVSPTGWTGTSGSKSTGPLYSSQTYSLSCVNR